MELTRVRSDVLLLSGKLLLLEQRLIKRVLLGDPVADEQIVIAVTIKVAGREPHRAAIFAYPRSRTCVDEAPMLIQEKLVFRNVVGHVKIQPAIAVEIVPQRAQTAALAVRYTELLRHFGKRAIAVVVEQEVALGLIGRRVQREGNFQAELLRRTSGTAGLVLDIAAHVEIEITVAVVIAPGCASPEAFQIGEPRIAHQHAVIVAKEHQRVVAGYDEIEPAVVVIVAPRRVHAYDPGIGEIFHLLKLPIAQIPEKQ